MQTCSYLYERHISKYSSWCNFIFEFEKFSQLSMKTIQIPLVKVQVLPRIYVFQFQCI